MKVFTRIFLAAAFILAVLAGCVSHIDVNEQLNAAEEAVEMGDFHGGAKICTDIVAKTDTADLTVRQLCRLAMIYAAVADNDVDNDANMAAAVHCFNRAYARNADSANMFVETLPIDLQGTARVALQLVRNHGIEPTNETDSLPPFPDDNDMDPDNDDYEVVLHEDIYE